MKLAMEESFSCALWVTAAFSGAACDAEIFWFLQIHSDDVLTIYFFFFFT